LNRISFYDINPVISDFGMCCPADQSSANKTLYGVLPFVAPEVLRGREFTKQAYIYVMLELISGEVPLLIENMTCIWL
jgi:hypothetical protein